MNGRKKNLIPKKKLKNCNTQLIIYKVKHIILCVHF